MRKPFPTSAGIIFALLAAGTLCAAIAVHAQLPITYDNPNDIRQELAEAQNQANAARMRANRLEALATQTTQTANKTTQLSAGLAARIQQAEAEIAVNRSKLGLIEQQRRQLRGLLATKQRPLLGLTASLQRLSRRPPILALLRPGSLRKVVYSKAAMAVILPEVDRRTAALRNDLARAKVLKVQAELAVVTLQKSETTLKQQRQNLVALETKQRLASIAAGNIANRESEKALALAEKTRDLDSLAEGLGKAGSLRAELAALPGPLLRPDRPEDTLLTATSAPLVASPGLVTYIMPAAGRLVAGFGEAPKGQAKTRGIALSIAAGAQVVAPSSGRIAFAGPYRGYGSIVIIEHAGGWTSLVTGLAQLDTRVGAQVVAGSPVGIAGAGRPVITLELRKDGNPVNPLEYMRAL